MLNNDNDNGCACDSFKSDVQMKLKSKTDDFTICYIIRSETMILKFETLCRNFDRQDIIESSVPIP